MGKFLEYVLQSFSHRNVCKNMHLYMIITWVYFVPSNWNFKFDFTIWWTIANKLLVNCAWKKENRVFHAKGLLWAACVVTSFQLHPTSWLVEGFVVVHLSLSADILYVCAAATGLLAGPVSEWVSEWVSEYILPPTLGQVLGCCVRGWGYISR